MIRVVLDSNVIVAGIPARSGTLANVIDHWRAGSYQLILSEHILTEVARTWRKPYWAERFPRQLASVALELLASNSELRTITTPVEGVATHPEDDLVLGVAVSSAADCLVTGDKALRAIVKVGETIVLSPQEFNELLAAGNAVSE